jgi:hypothetical protein
MRDRWFTCSGVAWKSCRRPSPSGVNTAIGITRPASTWYLAKHGLCVPQLVSLGAFGEAGVDVVSPFDSPRIREPAWPDQKREHQHPRQRLGLVQESFRSLGD